MIYHLNTAHPILVKEGGGSSSLTQASLDSVLARTRRSCNAQRAEKVTELIAKMVETDMLPISAVEGKGFHELIKFLEPEYTMASRRTVTRRIETHYEQRAQELLEELTMADKVAITTDCWSALTSESYITITCHYISDDWKVNSYVLLTESLPGRHTADHLAEKLNEAVGVHVLLHTCHINKFILE